MSDDRMNSGIAAMSERRAEFPSALSMQLAGIGVVPEARRALDGALGQYWRENGNMTLSFNRSVDEVIIGSGVHAAIYCATRVRQGYPRPLVIERSARPGGTFAMSEAPSFYLNSGNRPGLTGLPAKGQALNTLPGAPIQPADISMSEYQTNADLAFVVRVTLALYAKVVQKRTVTGWENAPDDLPEYPLRVQLDDTSAIYARRVIDARGLGDAVTLAESDRVLTFERFMGSLDSPFPMRGMRRVAVVGGGDSGKCAVESLLGIGPSSGMSTAALDYVESIDWYGRGLNEECATWLRDQRKRYARIGSYLGNRLTVRTTRSARVIPSLDSVIVDGQSYDKVITAVGSTRPEITSNSEFAEIFGRGFAVGRKYENREVYVIGPAANLEFSSRESEETFSNRPENRVAIFRYAPRTAALATMLPAPTA
jgi:hypothetical protein